MSVDPDPLRVAGGSLGWPAWVVVALATPAEPAASPSANAGTMAVRKKARTGNHD